MRLRIVWLAAMVGTAATLPAQQALPAKTAPTGSVTGHVFYADTNGPARLATMSLEGASAIDGYDPAAGDANVAHIASMKTLPDGSFSLSHIAPGAYYVFAAAPGYVSPLDALGLSQDEMAKPSKEVKERIAAAVPRVVVQANLAATADLTLERGAAVAGTVLYDDGSPAAGLNVVLLVQKKDKWVKPESDPAHMKPQVATDDRGAYRISGLPAQHSLVEVDLHLGRTSIEVNGQGSWSNSNGGTSVPIYSGSSLRQKDATPFQLKLGEERPGEDVTIPLNKLRSIAGVVAAASDGHVVNGGRIALLYADDKTLAIETSLTNEETGFSLNFVPEGDYLVRVTGAADLAYTDVPNAPGSIPTTRSESHAVHSYATAEQPLHVEGDVSGLTVLVPEKKPTPGS